MKYVPHDYQRYVTNYIETHPACAVLLDMGLGKTSITLTALLDLLFDTFEAHRILVIAPLRVARDTWPAEIEKWDHLKLLTYSVAVGSEKDRILSNEKYKGDALLQKSYTVDFLTKKTKINEGEIPQYYVEGNHEAIIDPDVFEMVQREIERRGKGKKYHSGVHAFSSKIKCGECGCWYGSKVWHSNSKYRKVIWRCNHKYDGDKTCRTPHLTDEEIQAAFLKAVNKLLETKGEVIANGYAMIPVLFDTTALEAEHDELLQETQVVSDMVQQCIYENAHVALDQAEYQKRYDALTQRFDKAKARLEEVTEQISQKQTQRANYEAFLKAFEKLPDQLPEFTLETWHGLVDYVTVYAEDDIRFTFKNGQEVKA